MTTSDPKTAVRPEHPNAVLTRRLYELLAAGDVAGYLDLIADDAVFHVGGDSIVAGEYIGKNAIVGLGMKALEETDGSWRTDLLGVLANDTHATTLHHWTAQRRGHSVDMNNVNVYRFEDGKVLERWEFIEHQDAHDSFWAP